VVLVEYLSIPTVYLLALSSTRPLRLLRCTQSGVSPGPSCGRLLKVGTYPEFVYTGGGYFYDEVLEYRVWVKVSGKDPELYSFATYADALRLSKIDPDAEPPLALVLQREYVDEPSPGEYRRIRKERMAEWQVGWLKGSRNNGTSIESFLRKVARKR